MLVRIHAHAARSTASCDSVPAMRNNPGILFAAGLLACSLMGQQSKAPAVASKVSGSPGSTSAADASGAAEVLEAEEHGGGRRKGRRRLCRSRQFERFDVHPRRWMDNGGQPLLTDDRKAFLKRVENKQYLVRDLDSVKVELHGDIAITYGRYIAQNRTGGPDKSWFSVWFERVYRKKTGSGFIYLSPIHGPTYGPDRQSVSNQ